MWKLQPTESGGESIVLLPVQEYVVGRKNCEILLSNDQSISRVHANLTVTEQAVTLKDSSKYGTFINGEKLATGSTKILQTGDKITFGVFQSKFSLEKECVVVCSSCVDNERKASLSQDLRSIGGRLVNSWTLDCTHLVMPTVKVTIKTICALLCCRPIVKPEFFSAFSRAVQQKLPLPKAEKFRPQIDEPSLAKEDVDLSARPERKSLFKGKTFLFLNSKQMKRLSQAVSCGGGVSQLLDEGSLPISLLESGSTCVVDMTSGNSQALIPPTFKKWEDSVAQILHRNGLRFITESEIGLAAIHVNNKTYCNPCCSMQSGGFTYTCINIRCRWTVLGHYSFLVRSVLMSHDTEKPAAAADLDMSLEELESIMSDEMDEPLQSAANKKQRLDSGTNSRINNPRLPNQQEGTESKSRKSTKNQQSIANNFQNLQLDRTGPAATNQGSERQSKRSSNQTPDLEAHSSAKTGKRPELEEVKEKEVSFVVVQRHKISVLLKASTSKSGSVNDPELPRRLLQIQFMSLTVSTSSRPRPGPLQTHDPNDKNVKRFRKKNVPGFNGLPNIIGGSDLAAYNRSKNSELEEWLRQAAEVRDRGNKESGGGGLYIIFTSSAR
uniref:Nibrin n=1 Tax=Sinocyclocheilus anshuiensis TaxID=1608454 RepID=A0A671Q8X6_9TELE